MLAFITERGRLCFARCLKPLQDSNNTIVLFEYSYVKSFFYLSKKHLTISSVCV